MHQVRRVIVNRTEVSQVAEPADIDRICKHLAALTVFTADAVGDRGESGRALVDYLDIDRRIKLGSWNEACAQRGIAWLRNDAYPALELDQIEVPHKTLISPELAITILRHYLSTGEATNLFPYPTLDDWHYWAGIPEEGQSAQANEAEPLSADDFSF